MSEKSMAALGSRAPAGPHLAGPHSTNEIGYSVIDITSPFLGRVSAFAPQIRLRNYVYNDWNHGQVSGPVEPAYASSPG